MSISEIGYWSEVKLDIIKEYAQAYSSILSNHAYLKYVYIDAFAGAGYHLTKSTKEIVLGSPINALYIKPSFQQYHFIDLDDSKTEILKSNVEEQFPQENVTIYNADCNTVLLKNVFPNVKYEDYKRGLCLLDPYGLHLDWEVIQKAGQMRSIEIFLNFPILDMNRNVLRRDEGKVDFSQIERMNKFWGDDSWKDVAYSSDDNLFGFNEKTDSENVVNAFVERLKKVAGFSYVPTPIPMRNTKGGIVYYLMFASHNKTAKKIVDHIFNKYKNRKS